MLKKLLFASLALFCGGLTVFAGPHDNPRLTDRLIVRPAEGATHYELLGLISGVQGFRTLVNEPPIYLFQVLPPQNPDSLLLALRRSPLIKTVQFDHWVFRRSALPNDSLFPRQWNMRNTGQNQGRPEADIHALRAWEFGDRLTTAAGDTVVIAIVDEGVDVFHEDLNPWVNRHEIPSDSIDNDNNGYIDDVYGFKVFDAFGNVIFDDHGTHVAGIAGAIGNNHIGIIGTCPGCQIMTANVGTDDNTGIEADVVEAYGYILEQRRRYNRSAGLQGAFVVAVNSSFGVNDAWPEEYPIWCEMYEIMGQEGILNAVATANQPVDVETQGDIPSLCSSDYLLVATNSNEHDHKAPNAAWGGTSVDLAAPGAAILSTISNNFYFTMGGTSQATPHVAGAIGLVYQSLCADAAEAALANPAQTALLVKQSIMESVDARPDFAGRTVSGGRLNAFEAQKRADQVLCGHHIDTPFDSLRILERAEIFPNPAVSQTILSFVSVDETVQVFVFNTAGQQVASATIFAGRGKFVNHPLIVEGWASGIYIVTLRGASGGTVAKKLMVAR